MNPYKNNKKINKAKKKLQKTMMMMIIKINQKKISKY